MKLLRFLILLLLFCTLAARQHTFAQDTAASYKYNKKGVSSVNQAATKLKESLSKDDEEETAKQYESLSKEFENRGDYTKAEENMKKALDIHTRLNNKKQIARTSRGLARIQESQNKIAPAIRNYMNSSEATDDRQLEEANTNDVKRLRNRDDLEIQAKYSFNSAQSFEQQGAKDEASNAYRNLAKTQLKQNQVDEAAATYEKAVKTAEKPEEAASLQKEMVQMYVDNNRVDKAIEVSKDLLNKAKQEKNTEEEVKQLRELAHVYQKGNDSTKSEELLKASYELAIRSNNTLQARATLAALTEFYSSTGAERKSLFYYNDFINRLDSMIRVDSSLLDSKIYEVTENRIRELEQERALQNELMARTTRFNYVLLGSVILMLLLVFLIGRALYAIRIKNKKIALQSLRREMNPHFIFNSLNSVNQYIAENNELEANKYLTAYSSLMRNIMENSNKDFVSLSVETDQLRKYLALEHQRFHDKFDYTLETDEALDPDAVMIPNMLIQPHLENAVWHGLRYKDTKGYLLLAFRKKGNAIEVTITDNGIGLAKSKALKTMNQKSHQSRGITNVEERMGLLNDIYKTQITMRIEERKEPGKSGTIVTIMMPITDKK